MVTIVSFYNISQNKSKLSYDDNLTPKEIIEDLNKGQLLPQISNGRKHVLSFQNKTIDDEMKIKDFFLSLQDSEGRQLFPNGKFPPVILSIDNSTTPQKHLMEGLVTQERIKKLYESLDRSFKDKYFEFENIWKSEATRKQLYDKYPEIKEDPEFTNILSNHQMTLNILSKDCTEYFAKYPFMYTFLLDISDKIQATTSLSFRDRIMKQCLEEFNTKPEFTTLRSNPGFMNHLKMMKETMDIMNRKSEEDDYMAQMNMLLRQIANESNLVLPVNNSRSSSNTNYSETYSRSQNASNGSVNGQQQPSGENSSVEQQINYRELYAEQLGQMIEFGFNDENENIAALQMASGNFEEALSIIIALREDQMDG
ncbi:Ubiquitin-associated domain/translation elongation factor EF-Ts, N-terminal and UBA-like domain and Ubiquitin-associated/translation elongation factor EF1B, N-terminal, eukaryote domain-containing protein [Strongyloides ratti]|uniref:UBA domain-containing protein n=1 Tax=Strongyloides ratti TaxID=34506 RepID=A0A090L897_STRRB|nr:Ubiquitin-associated domain/translation elongation factor EF-Ts, N-terminal and UBA-like domain and Ubiquitin-associated/translation elongation factor EF1B, N-terminal, eukaryote domain-containing protein [Strongyloides ratti]CEF65977.1 Ubiquitin-associated domain/translation elongation factor EF-Ts, N-terminal and UBA-like domain and Ubiquitin-associated/translation elongation factor EF1B, N-terminal, eukaryote domain-containing protein [Strongyloides ratti]